MKHLRALEARLVDWILDHPGLWALAMMIWFMIMLSCTIIWFEQGWTVGGAIFASCTVVAGWTAIRAWLLV